MWFDELRATIDCALALTPYDIMGMTETGGPGLDRRPARSAARLGDHYYVEIVDPSTGRPTGWKASRRLDSRGGAAARALPLPTSRVVAHRCDCGRTMLRVDRLRGAPTIRSSTRA
jgi:phenylacetate-coenzyme A ligase PaaK-like adenylate-forming protein